MSLSNREIGKTIKSLRKSHRLTGGELGFKAGLSQSKISKIETGFYAQLSYSEIEHILHILKAPKIILQQVLRSIGTGESNKNNAYLYRHSTSQAKELEESATVVKVYCSTLIPSLLQTPAYRHAYLELIGAADQMPDDIKVTTLRQDSLWAGGRTYELLIHHAALYTSFAPKNVQLAQLDRIERMISASNVRIGILPVDAGMPVAEYGPFAIYDERVVVDVLLTGEIKTTDAESIELHLSVFEDLRRRAHYGNDAIELVRQTMEAFA